MISAQATKKNEKDRVIAHEKEIAAFKACLEQKSSDYRTIEQNVNKLHDVAKDCQKLTKPSSRKKIENLKKERLEFIYGNYEEVLTVFYSSEALRQGIEIAAESICDAVDKKNLAKLLEISSQPGLVATEKVTKLFMLFSKTVAAVIKEKNENYNSRTQPAPHEHPIFNMRAQFETTLLDTSTLAKVAADGAEQAERARDAKTKTSISQPPTATEDDETIGNITINASERSHTQHASL